MYGNTYIIRNYAMQIHEQIVSLEIKEKWYQFPWTVGAVIPFLVNILLRNGKKKSADVLLNTYVEFIKSRIKVKYKSDNLMIVHDNTQINSLLKLDLLSNAQRSALLKISI